MISPRPPARPSSPSIRLNALMAAATANTVNSGANMPSRTASPPASRPTTSICRPATNTMTPAAAMCTHRRKRGVRGVRSSPEPTKTSKPAAARKALTSASTCGRAHNPAAKPDEHRQPPYDRHDSVMSLVPPGAVQQAETRRQTPQHHHHQHGDHETRYERQHGGPLAQNDARMRRPATFGEARPARCDRHPLASKKMSPNGDTFQDRDEWLRLSM